jgi:hypothetical protein
MNKSDEACQFDIAKPEQARWLAIMLSELQGYGVRYEVSKDSNLIYVRIL